MSKSINFAAFTEKDWFAFAGASEGARIAYTETSTDSVAIIVERSGAVEVCLTNECGDMAAFHMQCPTQRAGEVLAAGIDYETEDLADFGFERIA